MNQLARLFDIIFSILGLILFLPLLLIAAICVFLEKPGENVFYKQLRVGKNGEKFLLIKLRTMQMNSDNKSLLTIGDTDERITKVGRILRKYKIDELTQLINVISGDMSIVGPRPEVQEFVDNYSDEQMVILKTKPGITDYASIHFFDESKILAASDNPRETYIREILPSKVQLNMIFINNPSLSNYFRVIILTLKAIFNR